MGKHVYLKSFDQSDFIDFHSILAEETSLLKKWIKNQEFADGIKETGFELEGWLLDETLHPFPENMEFIKKQDSPIVVTEVAKSCIEINTDHFHSHGHAILEHEKDMAGIIHHTKQVAAEDNHKIIYIGTLPTGTLQDFCEENLTDDDRYHIMDTVLKDLRQERPTQIKINGRDDHISFASNSIALIGAASAFQIHFRVGISESVRCYNAAEIIAAPMMAMCCNSPALFGHCLWEESRIPLIEQLSFLKQDHLPRSTFGTNYLKDSILEFFLENLHCYSLLIPKISNCSADKLFHLRLHNGTINRWNRPIIDFDKKGNPHFRIEHRILPAGPTTLDMCANTAFYMGVMQFLSSQEIPPETQINFSTARNNFYLAAKYGLNANLTWTNHLKINAADLITKILLPLAHEGLNQLDIDHSEAKYYLSVIEARAKKMCTGSAWQRTFLKKNNNDYTHLTNVYLELQNKGDPISEWPY